MQSPPTFIVLLATYPSAAELLFTVCCIYSNASQNNIAQEGKFVVLMAVTIKVAAFCEARLCNLLDIHQHSEWACCLHCTSNRNTGKLLPYYMASHPSRWLLWVSWDVSIVPHMLCTYLNWIQIGKFLFKMVFSMLEALDSKNNPLTFSALNPCRLLICLPKQLHVSHSEFMLLQCYLNVRSSLV
jgi:hypothetical protein